MNKKPWSKWTDEELADEAQRGQSGQGAIVETTRRLRVSTERYSGLLLWLTVILIVLTIILACAAAHDMRWL